jgi:hypothetical protein
MKPTMAKGAIIKYNIAEFSPWAGFSPNCRAVLVQTAHCARKAVETATVNNKNNNMDKMYFTYLHKVTAHEPTENICLTEINEFISEKTSDTFILQQLK